MSHSLRRLCSTARPSDLAAGALAGQPGLSCSKSARNLWTAHFGSVVPEESDRSSRRGRIDGGELHVRTGKGLQNLHIARPWRHLSKNTLGHCKQGLAGGPQAIAECRESMITHSSSFLSQFALSLSSLVIGYYLGTGRSLFSYRSKAKKATDDDDNQQHHSSFESEDDSIEFKNKKAAMNVFKAGLLEECKLVLLVRTDLKMDKGKIAAQCSHATLACYKNMLTTDPKLLKHWDTIG